MPARPLPAAPVLPLAGPAAGSAARQRAARPAGVRSVSPGTERHPARSDGTEARRSGLDRLTLRFTMAGLERHYQEVMGRESLPGFRMATLFGVGLWLGAASLLIVTTPVDPTVAGLTGAILALMNLAAFLATPWATTVDRQQGLATPLAAANAFGALGLAAAAGVVDAYAASASILIQVFWFVAVTRFVFAAVRSAAIIAAFAVVVALHSKPTSLLLDAFILVAATGAILVALYRLELARRRLFQKDLVIAEQSLALESEKAESDKLLFNVLPATVAAKLLADPGALAEEAPETTVLFADLVGFTPLAARLPASEVVHHLNEIFSRFDDLAERRGVEKVKTIGDAYMAVAGLPLPQHDHATRVVDLGLAMIVAASEYAATCGLPLTLRVGIHSGPVVAGVIGKRKLMYDLWGDTVNVASRMESHGVTGAVQVSEATWRLLGDAYTGTPRGEIELKGRGRMPAWIVTAVAVPASMRRPSGAAGRLPGRTRETKPTPAAAIL
jgi:class 3 adenylate cyclase